MKIKNKILLLSSTGILVASPIALIACNIRSEREIKHNELSSKIWKSEEWKTLRKMIQSKFKDYAIETFFVYNFLNGKTVPQSVAAAKTREDLDRLFLKYFNGSGNFTESAMRSSVIPSIIKNQVGIDKKYRLLLNKISTVYNRRFNVYPTQINQIVKNGENFVHFEIRVDLQTAMKRRPLGKFLDINFDIPVYDGQYTQANIWKYFDTNPVGKTPSDYAKKIDTIEKLKNILWATVLNSKGLANKEKGTIDISHRSLLGTGVTNFYMLRSKWNGVFPGYTTTGSKLVKYTPQHTGDLDNAKNKYTFYFRESQWDSINKRIKTFKGSDNYYYPTISMGELIELNKNDKVSKLEEAMVERFFTGKKAYALFQELFGANGQWEVKVVARTWAGNPASSYTIADWVENIGHRGDFFFYFTHKTDKSQNYYYKMSSYMDKVKEGA